jgi:hypothetical protein
MKLKTNQSKIHMLKSLFLGDELLTSNFIIIIL